MLSRLPILALALPFAQPVTAATQDSAVQVARQKRSVLFCLIDTCRADRMSVYGHDRPTTPFLEEIASRGVVFERCYSQAPWTKPSMAALLTSRYPSETGVYKLFQRLPGRFETFPEVLAKAGWHTAGFSANPIMGEFSNYTQGFREFVESTQVNQANPIQFASGSAAKLNEYVLPWLRRNESWPVFLYVHSVDPHEEYSPAEPYLEAFADPDEVEAYRMEWSELLETRPPVPGNHVTQWNFEQAEIDPEPFIATGLDLYDADIRANDAEIERLWSKIQEDGWGDDVVFVLTSDHGEEFFEHGGTSHGYSLYRELLHVPLILYAPGLLPAGKRVEEPVRSIDIYPTLLDLLDLEAPAGLTGRSLLPLVHEHSEEPAPRVFSEQTEDPGGRQLGSAAGVALSVVDGDRKFILNLRSPYRRERPRHELYDLATDPGELRNLAEQAPEAAVAYERLLLGWSAANLGHAAIAEDVDASTLDPELLEGLEALGYAGSEEDTPEPLPDLGERLPAISRAILEQTMKWELYALDPNDGGGSKSFHGHPVRGRATLEGSSLEELRREIYNGIAAGDDGRNQCFRPKHGLRAEFRGMTVDLVISYECSRVRVFLADREIGASTTSPGVESAVNALYEAAGLELGN